MAHIGVLRGTVIITTVTVRSAQPTLRLALFVVLNLRSSGTTAVP